LILAIFCCKKMAKIRKNVPGGSALADNDDAVLAQVFPKKRIFRVQKMVDFKEIPTEAEALDRIRRGHVRLPPLRLRLCDIPPRAGQRISYDAILEASWAGRRFTFELEYKNRSTPRVFEDTLARLSARARTAAAYPMIMVPYLSSDQLEQLERQSVSGIDLCGNGVVVIPGELCIVRTGQPNRFPQSSPIKNIYRGRSSVVARVLLARPRYAELNEIQREIEARNGRIALSTISKVIATLDEELVINRKNRLIRLLQPDVLLEKLARNYRPPRKARRFLAECRGTPTEFLPELFGEAGRSGIRSVVTGACSAVRYAAMAREEKVQVYCSSIEALIRAAGGSICETERFADLELLETNDDTVYFDARPENDIRWASPVESYLELMSGDKRDRETADQIRARILAEWRLTEGE
jgi:hypothetical protein